MIIQFASSRIKHVLYVHYIIQGMAFESIIFNFCGASIYINLYFYSLYNTMQKARWQEPNNSSEV